MSLRPPSQYSANAMASGGADGSGFNLLEHEIAGEMASALGRTGERVEKALAALRSAGDDAPGRETLLRDAARAVHAYFIQREACGMRRHQGVIRDYDIPKQVLARLGAT